MRTVQDWVATFHRRGDGRWARRWVHTTLAVMVEHTE
ncbi:hypothetical protein A4R44_03541 [Amycolatopsis sp. M39]|nr:hypothetical protein A4R44_03541 [Amycolatopsis sp. M39]